MLQWFQFKPISATVWITTHHCNEWNFFLFRKIVHFFKTIGIQIASSLIASPNFPGCIADA